MPDSDRVNNAPHLKPRHGVDPAAHPSPIGTHEHFAAVAIEGHIRDGDAGAVRRFVHDLEYELGPFRVSPWRVLEYLAGRAITRQRETPAGPVSGAEVVSAQRETAAAAAAPPEGTTP